MDEKLFKVGELAKVAGKTVRAMHLYEEMGLLRPVSRSAGGYRLYTVEAASRVRWISRMQDLGFSLPEVQAFLRSWEGSPNGPNGMQKVRTVFEEKLRETRAQMARLQDLERELVASVAYLELCGSCESSHSQHECGCCAQPGHEPEATPGLVSGLAKPHTKSHERYDVPIANLTTEGR